MASKYVSTTLPPLRESRPLLPHVPLAVILSMNEGSRLTTEALSDLRTLCPETRIQINMGWKDGNAPHITTTAHDLVDAYRHCCRAVAECDGPVLIVEEDAVFLNRNRVHYACVDEFVAKRNYDIYSLGSFGEFSADDKGEHHRRFVSRLGFSQAIVWNKSARDMILARPEGDMHIDVHTLSAMKRKYTYYRPLVVQLFPTTENMRTWCIECTQSSRERIVVCAWQGFLQRVLGLDRCPDGWTTLYKMNDAIRHVKQGIGVVKGLALYVVGTLVVFLMIRGRRQK